MKKPVVLVVLDGWGYREDPTNNAIAQAKKPNFDQLWSEYPHTTLSASGEAVGLPAGQMGNSEVGHMTIGAGTIIHTDLTRIDKAIADGSFATNPAIQILLAEVKKNNSTLHLMGLIGPGGVHAHSGHLYAALLAAKAASINRVAIHAFLDGRDTPPQSAADYLSELENQLSEIGVGTIASLSGRYYAMDRDSNWDRLTKAEAVMFEGKGEIATGIKPSDYLRGLYQTKNQFDEHLLPTVFPDASGQPIIINQNDGVFFLNFRPDRARMLTTKLVEQKTKLNLTIVTMTNYGEMCQQCLIAFPPIEIKTTLAGEISKASLKQVHIAETEKFAHATYFLNGGEQKPNEGEKDILLDSRKDVPTHDLAPKMRAEAITDKAIEEINAGTDFIFINYANADMVGHTANVPAIIEAVEELDEQLGRLNETLKAKDGIMFVTADHGNAELNIDPETSAKHTAHTTNPVPAILTKKDASLRANGGLSDIAPTILNLLELPVPEAMTGKSLLV